MQASVPPSSKRSACRDPQSWPWAASSTVRTTPDVQPITFVCNEIAHWTRSHERRCVRRNYSNSRIGSRIEE
jgi:hypothetical protein